MNTFSDFISWEAQTRDTIDFKKIYVDMAGGDIVAGLALSEIVYWYLPGNNGKTKLRVQHDNELWIAAPRAEWWDRCRMTPRQSDRALNILKQAGLIITKRYKWNNTPTVHIRIVESRFVELWNTFINVPATNPILPNGEMEITKPLNLVTETTTKTTNFADTPSVVSGDAPKPIQPHIALIDAYWSGLPGGKPIGEEYPRHVKLAVEMVARQITPLILSRFLADVYDPDTQVWEYKKWHNRPIPLEEVGKLLPIWQANNAPESPASIPGQPYEDPLFDKAFEGLGPIEAAQLRDERVLQRLERQLGGGACQPK